MLKMLRINFLMGSCRASLFKQLYINSHSNFAPRISLRKMSNSTTGEPPEQDLEKGLTEAILKLEEIDTNLYRGSHLWKPIGGRGVFGGQVVGQALVAAGKTKPADVMVHSFHSYFVKTGNPDMPIIYHVDRVRDGRSFCTRTVRATQAGANILTMQVSYHRPEESSLNYQYKMPEVPLPENVTSLEELLRAFLQGDISEKRRSLINRHLAQEIPIDVKPLDPEAHFRLGSEVKDPRLLYWVRAKGHIGEDCHLHQCVAAYLSDMWLLFSALVPFPKFRPAMMASLDHSMWFHAPFYADRWMLYECESPFSGSARSMTFGRLWKQDGNLAVSVAQEGVIRGKMVQDSKL